MVVSFSGVTTVPIAWWSAGNQVANVLCVRRNSTPSAAAMATLTQMSANLGTATRPTAVFAVEAVRHMRVDAFRCNISFYCDILVDFECRCHYLAGLVRAKISCKEAYKLEGILAIVF